jgi:hypothetical protein
MQLFAGLTVELPEFDHRTAQKKIPQSTVVKEAVEL